MDGLSDYHTKWSKSEGKKEMIWYDIWYHLYMEFKIWHKKSLSWNNDRLTDIDNQTVVAQGEGE